MPASRLLTSLRPQKKPDFITPQVPKDEDLAFKKLLSEIELASRQKSDLLDEVGRLVKVRDESLKVKLPKGLGVDEEVEKLKKERGRLLEEVESINRSLDSRRTEVVRELRTLSDYKTRLARQVKELYQRVSVIAEKLSRSEEGYKEYGSEFFASLTAYAGQIHKELGESYRKLVGRSVELDEKSAELASKDEELAGIEANLQARSRSVALERLQVRQMVIDAQKERESLAGQLKFLGERRSEVEKLESELSQRLVSVKKTVELTEKEVSEKKSVIAKRERRLLRRIADVVAKEITQRATEERQRVKDIQLRDKEERLKRAFDDLKQRQRMVI